MRLERLKLGPGYMDPIEKFEIFNIANIHLRSLPTGIVQYPYTFILPKEAYDTIQSFLSSRWDFKKQPDNVMLYERQWDWTHYDSRNGIHAKLIYFISVSQRVFTDTEFRGLILEEIL